MAAPPPKPQHFLLLLLLLFHATLLHATPPSPPPPPSTTHPDLPSLMQFKTSSDPSNTLTTWTYSSNPCTTFQGVTCLHNRVTRLVLENLNLQGRLDSLTSLTTLRILSLKNNQLTGPLPDLSNLTSLKLLFLSNNLFSGDFPPSLPPLLFRLDLSNNNFSGDIPVQINRLNHLLTLRLEQNKFSGSVEVLNLQNLQDFNISGNLISGEIPATLSTFPVSSFLNNGVLCGFPLQNCTEPKIPGLGKPDENKPGNGIVTSSPGSMPSTASLPDHKKSTNRHGNGKISTVAIIAIIIGDVLVLALVSLILYCYFWRNFNGKSKTVKSTSNQILEGEKIVYSSSPYPNPALQNGFERGRMVFFEGAKRFELEDLLRASAEMLGKGGFGTAYKAVLDDGNVVAVKRLKEAAIGGKREFEQQMEVLGRVRHPNVVSLKAYYFARDEKLLVYEYMSNGNLFWLLHGNRGPGRTPLDWTTRLKVASGAARGLVFIHHFSKSLKLTHGNIKSTNILLDKTGTACISDFGLSAFAPPTTAPKSNGYRAPELSTMDSRKTTQKSDVYSFGVLLLELLTGKCPSVMDNGGNGYGGAMDLPRWVQSVVREEWTAEVFDLELMRYKDIEEEMVGLLQIAMSCTAGAPDQRPTIGYVLKMIEEIRGVEVSPSHEMLDSVSDSPSVSGDTCRASE